MNIKSTPRHSRNQPITDLVDQLAALTDREYSGLTRRGEADVQVRPGRIVQILIGLTLAGRATRTVGVRNGQYIATYVIHMENYAHIYLSTHTVRRWSTAITRRSPSNVVWMSARDASQPTRSRPESASELRVCSTRRTDSRHRQRT